MSFYGLFMQGAYLVTWLIMLIGATMFLRRDRGGGAVSAVLGAGIHVVTLLGSLFMTLLITMRICGPHVASRIMMGLGIPGLIGDALFAIGFLQLALAAAREAPSGSA